MQRFRARRMLTGMHEGAGKFELDALLREAGWIRSLARGLAEWPDRAPDLEQETWLAALRARPATDRGLRPWLATVMRNASRAGARSEANRASREGLAARDEALPSAAELAVRADLQRALVGHVLALDDPYRSTILLCFYEGLSPAEIARRQGLPAGSVRSRLSRGVQLLRARLDEGCGGNRERWLAALLPLKAPPPPKFAPWTTLVIGVAMKKLVLAAVVVLALFVAWRAWPYAALPAPHAEVAGLAQTPASLPAPESSFADEAPAPGARRDAPAPTPAEPAARPTRRVRLLDERTGEPVPEFEIAIVDADAAGKPLRSNEQGGLELPLAPGARLRLDLVENLGGNDLIQTSRIAVAPLRVEIEAPPQASELPLELLIPVGPTYRLALRPPPGHGLADLEATLRSADPRQAFDVARARVREGAQPWLRFRPAARFVAAGPPWKLELVTTDGLWSAKALVDRREGVAPDPIPLNFEARAHLFGSLREPDGKPLVREFVRLEREGASFDNPANRPMMFATRDEGRYDFPAVAPGTWHLSATVDGHDEVRLEIELAALESREIDLTAPAAAPGSRARLEGLIDSTTGHYADAAYVSVFPLGLHSGRGAKVNWSEADGRRQGRFVLDDLKPGGYRVSVRVPGLLTVEPAEVDVEAEAGGAPLRFVVRDDVECVSWHVRAKGAERALETFWVALEAGELSTGASAQQGLAVIENIPRGTHCNFSLRAEGFAPLFGEVVADGTTSEALPAGFELRPGWGSEVTVVDTERRPLPDARLFFDGSPAGATDERGKARVVLDHEPHSVRVELPGWHLAAQGNTIAAETGRFRTWEPSLFVILQHED